MSLATRLHILHSRHFSPNEYAFLFPLHQMRGQLKEARITFKCFTRLTPKLTECDVLWVSHRYFKRWWLQCGPEAVLSKLHNLKQQVKHLVWFDLSDSTGTPQFMVMPYVDQYVKNQVLRDKTLYRKEFSGARVFGDFYQQLLGGDENIKNEAHLVYPLKPAFEDKLFVGWNSGLCFYGAKKLYTEQLAWRLPMMNRWLRNRWVSPSKPRRLKLSCRIGSTYTRETISLSRRRIREIAKPYMDTGMLSRRQYIDELRQASATLSPFGLGEISLRDFEVTINGSAMIKQDMSHVDTWPNLWNSPESYVPFSWDLSNLRQILEVASNDSQEMSKRAACAQTLYRESFEVNKLLDNFVARVIQFCSLN